MHLLGAETEAPHLVEDLVGGLGPLEGLALVVVDLDVSEDRFAQLREARVRAALERLVGEYAEEALDEVQPRRIRRSEVELEPRVWSQPPLHHGGLVRGEVVQHDVDLQPGFDLLVDLAEGRRVTK